jgi:hypothetical protein
MTNYRELVRYAMDSGSAPGFAVVRERLADSALSDAQRQTLAALDEEALEYVLELPTLDSDLLADAPAQPLDHWWWHLGAIRQGRYPAARLPPSLRAIYQERPKAA